MNIKVAQRLDEFDCLLRLMRACHCESYLEIGSLVGGSLSLVRNAFPRSLRMFAIDLPHSPKNLALLEDRADAFDVQLFIGSSTESDVREAVLAHAPFDCIFIDGDHSYEAVKLDFDIYRPMAKKLMAFHDIENEMFGVKRFWSEVKVGKNRQEFVYPNIENDFGIGVLDLRY